VVTPNRYEAQLLSGLEIHTLDDMKVAASATGAKDRVSQRGGMAGNLRGVDVWFDGHHLETLTTALVDTNTHGTGCTCCTAIAANLALGVDVSATSKEYVTTALYALDIGRVRTCGTLFSALYV